MPRGKSKKAHDKVVDAAIQLFADRGIDGASMDAIAEGSGVSKATIYKHWPDKDALALEVMAKVHGLDIPRPEFKSGNLEKDLVDTLGYKHPEPFPEVREKMLPHLMAYAGRNQRFGAAWRSRVIEPQRYQIVEVLERGIKQGRLPKDLDIPTSLTMLIGPMLYRYIFSVEGVDQVRLAQAIGSAFVRAFGLTKKR